jgi:hypothetical protein
LYLESHNQAPHLFLISLSNYFRLFDWLIVLFSGIGVLKGESDD